MLEKVLLEIVKCRDKTAKWRNKIAKDLTIAFNSTAPTMTLSLACGLEQFQLLPPGLLLGC